MKNISRIFLGILTMLSFTLSAQEHEQENDGPKDHGREIDGHENIGHETLKKHRLAVEFGYTHVPDGFEEVHSESEEQANGSVWVPTFGIEYLYRFNHKWSAALTVSMEAGNYLITYNREDLQRENVLIIAAVADYEILPRWSVFAGGGMEIEKNQNFGLVRLGTAYSFPLKKNWDIAPTVSFDHKIGYYSYEFVVAIGKSF